MPKRGKIKKIIKGKAGKQLIRDIKKNYKEPKKFIDDIINLQRDKKHLFKSYLGGRETSRKIKIA